MVGDRRFQFQEETELSAASQLGHKALVKSHTRSSFAMHRSASASYQKPNLHYSPLLHRTSFFSLARLGICNT